MKYKYLFILLFVVLNSYATQTETIHSSFSTYGEIKEYSHSKQKKDGAAFGLGADIHYLDVTYKFLYEAAMANTYQPPLKEDLKVQKVFLQYGYNINPSLYLHINYINILDDNIAITTHGEVYGIGLGYKFNKQYFLDVSQYYTDYYDFSVMQSDLKLNYKFSFNTVGMKITSITKYLNLSEKNKNAFTKNAKDSYLTSGIKVHAHYDSYHVGVGAYFGKRAFAIMYDGFKVQHHAMEFDRTYAIGIGKNISDYVLRFQYIYQRATELPIKNTKVTMAISRLTLNYKF